MHDVIIVGVPLLAILAGILFNRSDAKDLRSEIKDVRSEVKDVRSEVKDLRADMQSRFNKVEGHLDRIDADLRQFYHLTGKLEARMDSLESRREDFQPTGAASAAPFALPEASLDAAPRFGRKHTIPTTYTTAPAHAGSRCDTLRYPIG